MAFNPVTQASQEQILQSVVSTADSALQVKLGAAPTNYDYVALTQTDSTTDVYTFKRGGSGGTTVGTVTIVYTDATHNTLSTVTRT